MKLKTKEGTVEYNIIQKIIEIQDVIPKKYDIKHLENILSELIKKCPGHSLMFPSFHKNDDEYDINLKTLKKLKFKLLGKKVVYKKKLTKITKSKLTFKTLKEVKTKKPFQELFYKTIKKSPYLTDYFDSLDPNQAFRDYVITKGKPGWNFLAYDGKKLVGYFCLNKRDYKGEYGTINHIAVNPKHRGKGYALEFMKKAEEELIKAKIKEYRGSTDEKNFAMIKTFKKFGAKKSVDILFYTYKPEIAFKRFLK